MKVFYRDWLLQAAGLLDEELDALISDVEGSEAAPTTGFQRVIQRAAIHVQSSGRSEVTGANVLVAIFAERESHAAYFLPEQDMTRYDAVNFIAHGVAKDPAFGESRPVTGASEKGSSGSSSKKEDKEEEDKDEEEEAEAEVRRRRPAKGKQRAAVPDDDYVEEDEEVVRRRRLAKGKQRAVVPDDDQAEDDHEAGGSGSNAANFLPRQVCSSVTAVSLVAHLLARRVGVANVHRLGLLR